MKFKIEIEIPEEEIKKAIIDSIVEQIRRDDKYGNLRYSFKGMYAEEVKKMLYEPDLKKQIIERATTKAAHEIRRKAMPLLMKQFEEDE